MNRNSITGMSRALIAAVLLATAALSGCASLSDESFDYAGNDVVTQDRMTGA
jgi:outer membrane murein-binding lipoprotein Lpp